MSPSDPNDPTQLLAVAGRRYSFPQGLLLVVLGISSANAFHAPVHLVILRMYNELVTGCLSVGLVHWVHANPNESQCQDRFARNSADLLSRGSERTPTPPSSRPPNVDPAPVLKHSISSTYVTDSHSVIQSSDALLE